MKKNQYRKMTDILALTVFGVFALCVAAVLLTSAKVYQKLTDQATESYEHRVAQRYLTTRFHQSPHVHLEDFEGLQTMTIREEIDGRAYVTRVYCHEGYIRELFAAESAAVSPDDGEIILAAENLTFSVDGELMSVVITHPDRKTQELFLWLPAWKGAAP